MSTFSLTASGDNLAKSNSSSWKKGDGAYQGSYGGSDPYCGVMRWPSLRTSIDWADQEISRIQLTLKFAASGRAATKNLYLYVASKNSYSGSASAMRDMDKPIGTISTGGSAYNSTRTITFDADHNASAFKALVNWLKTDTIYALAIYHKESSSSGSASTNYLGITSAKIVIEYELGSGTGSLDAASYIPGQTATLTITPPEVDDVVITHSVVWRCGNSSTQPRTPTDLTDSYTIPTSWLQEFAGHESGQAECVLNTYADGVQRGEARVFSFTVTAGPKPQISRFDVRRYETKIDEHGDPEIVLSSTGDHVLVWVDAVIDTEEIPGRTGSARIVYGGRTVSLGTGTAFTKTRDATVITAVIPTDSAMTFDLYVSDGNNQAKATARVETGTTALHIGGDGHSVTVGGFGDAADAGEENFKTNWPFRAFAGIENIRIGTVAPIELTTSNRTDIGRDVYFDPPFPNGVIPAVMVGQSTTGTGRGTGSTAVCVVDGSVTETGFKLSRFNDSDGTRTVGAVYLAYAGTLSPELMALLDANGLEIITIDGNRIVVPGGGRSVYTIEQMNDFIEEVL